MNDVKNKFDKKPITFRSFPSDSLEFLVMLYMQQQDISNLSPKELTKMYQVTHSEIKEAFRTKKPKKEEN